MTASTLTIAQGEEKHEAATNTGQSDPSAGDVELIIGDDLTHYEAVLHAQKLVDRLKELDWPTLAVQ